MERKLMSKKEFLRKVLLNLLKGDSVSIEFSYEIERRKDDGSKNYLISMKSEDLEHYDIISDPEDFKKYFDDYKKEIKDYFQEMELETKLDNNKLTIKYSSL
jgi:hypothetical protein